jgi:hypothetical protein
MAAFSVFVIAKKSQKHFLPQQKSVLNHGSIFCICLSRKIPKTFLPQQKSVLNHGSIFCICFSKKIPKTFFASTKISFKPWQHFLYLF